MERSPGTWTQYGNKSWQSDTDLPCVRKFVLRLLWYHYIITIGMIVVLIINQRMWLTQGSNDNQLRWLHTNKTLYILYMVRLVSHSPELFTWQRPCLMTWWYHWQWERQPVWMWCPGIIQNVFSLILGTQISTSGVPQNVWKLFLCH